MKEIIYLDTSFLHSFIAQTNSGLPTLVETELSEAETKSSETRRNEEKSHEFGVQVSTGNINVGVMKSPSAKGDYKLKKNRGNTDVITLTQSEAGREIISRQLHDNALIEFEKYLEENNLVNIGTNQISIGGYIKLKTTFRIIDFNYFKQVSDEKLGEILIRFGAGKEIVQQISSSSNERFKKQLKSKLEQLIQEQTEEIKFYQRLIEYVSNLLPTNAFIKVNNFVIPLKNSCLRERADELNFKYGRGETQIEATILGKITSQIVETNTVLEDSKFLKSFSDMIGAAISVLEVTNVIEKGDYVLSPIAIYFE